VNSAFARSAARSLEEEQMVSSGAATHIGASDRNRGVRSSVGAVCLVGAHPGAVSVGGGCPQVHSAFARSAARSLEEEQMVSSGAATHIGASDPLDAPERPDAVPFEIRAIAPVHRALDHHA
jgi:hypothetical protein